VEKAVRESPLSLNAQTEGSEVLVKLPRMTKETIEKMVKLVNMEAEGAHQSIRRARQKGMEAVKKIFKNGSADDRKRAEKEVTSATEFLLHHEIEDMIEERLHVHWALQETSLSTTSCWSCFVASRMHCCAMHC